MMLLGRPTVKNTRTWNTRFLSSGPHSKLAPTDGVEFQVERSAGRRPLGRIRGPVSLVSVKTPSAHRFLEVFPRISRSPSRPIGGFFGIKSSMEINGSPLRFVVSGHPGKLHSVKLTYQGEKAEFGRISLPYGSENLGAPWLVVSDLTFRSHRNPRLQRRVVVEQAVPEELLEKLGTKSSGELLLHHIAMARDLFPTRIRVSDPFHEFRVALPEGRNIPKARNGTIFTVDPASIKRTATRRRRPPQPPRGPEILPKRAHIKARTPGRSQGKFLDLELWNNGNPMQLSLDGELFLPQRRSYRPAPGYFPGTRGSVEAQSEEG